MNPNGFEIRGFLPPSGSVSDSMWRMPLGHSRLRSKPLGYRTLFGSLLLAVLLFAPALAHAQDTAVDDGPIHPVNDVARPHLIDNDSGIGTQVVAAFAHERTRRRLRSKLRSRCRSWWASCSASTRRARRAA